MNEKILSKLIQNLPQGYALYKIIYDEYDNPIDYKYVTVNNSYELLTGQKKENIIGKKISEVIPEIKNDKFNWIEYYANISKNNKREKFEIFSTPLNNKWLKVEVYSPEKDYFAMLLYDYEEEIEIEKIAKIGRWTHYLNNGKLFWTKNLFDMLEINPKNFNLTFNNFLELIHPQDKIIFKNSYINSLNSNFIEFEYRIIKHNSEIIWLKSSLYVEYEENKPIRTNGIVRDITIEKNQELFNKENDMRHNQAQKLGKFGYWEWDLNTNQEYWSDEYFRILDLEPGEINPTFENFIGFVYYEDRNKMINNSKQLSKYDLEEKQIEFRIKSKTGKIKYIRNFYQIILDKNNNPYKLIGSIQDITDQKLKEEELIRVNNELEKSNERFEASNEQLEATNEELVFAYHTNEVLINKMNKMTDLTMNLNDISNKNEILAKAFNYLFDFIPEADFGLILRIDDEYLNIIDSRGFNKEDFNNLKIKSNTYTGMNKIKIIENFEEIQTLDTEKIPKEKYSALKKLLNKVSKVLYIPIHTDDKFYGSISLYINEKEKKFNKETIKFSEFFSRLISLYLFSKDYGDQIKNSYKNFSNKLAAVAEEYDDDTGVHINRVGSLSEYFAKKLNLSKNQIEDIRNFSPLHDIGKIFIPSSILKKPDKLNSEEWEIIKTHTTQAKKLLGDDKRFETALKIAMYHHEKFDGTGYPEGLKGDEIPIEAQIVALVDVYDALRSVRTYKKAYSHEKSISIITGNSQRTNSKHFNPKILDIFINNSDEIQRIWKETSNILE